MRLKREQSKLSAYSFFGDWEGLTVPPFLFVHPGDGTEQFNWDEHVKLLPLKCVCVCVCVCVLSLIYI